jgi:hypothetical protein
MTIPPSPPSVSLRFTFCSAGVCVPLLCFLVAGVAWFLFFVVILLLSFCCNFYFFSFILLSVLSYLPTMTWFDLEVEIVLWVLASIWFFAVPALQLSFYSDSCFTCIELFTEFLYNLHRLMRLWNRLGLLMILFGLLIITIASCSVLLDQIQYLF